MTGTDVRERWAMGIEARALVLISMVLLSFGLATLYSASALVAMQKGLAPSTFVVQQLTGVMVGVVAFAVAAKVDATLLQRFAWPLMLLSLVLMALTITPGIATWIGGSRRYLMGGSVQPAELAKIAIVAWTAMEVLKKGERMRRLSQGMPVFLLVGGALVGVAFVQPDLSMGFMFALLMGLVLFAAGVRIGHFVVLGMGAALGVAALLKQNPYAWNRILSFLGSDNVAKHLSDQQRFSMMAVGSGGWFGTGFGEGKGQYGWIQMGMDDFIGATVGEEWGFVGLTLVVLAFALYTWLGFRIARQASSPFLRLLALGLTANMAITAYVHLGVVINLLPNTGLTLPFFSNGRSNLVVTFLITGILVNIGSRRERVYGSLATDPLTTPA